MASKVVQNNKMGVSYHQYVNWFRKKIKKKGVVVSSLCWLVHSYGIVQVLYHPNDPLLLFL